MNSQVSPSTKLTPHELFHGRPAQKFEVLPEPCTSPPIDAWLKYHLKIQTQASEQLRKVRNRQASRANRTRQPQTYKVGDYALVHNRRWPHRKFSKLETQWQGPFRITKVQFNSIEVMTSPTLGGPLKVTIGDTKKWTPEIYEDLTFTTDLFEPDEEEPEMESPPAMDVDSDCDSYEVQQIFAQKVPKWLEVSYLVERISTKSSNMGAIKFICPKRRFGQLNLEGLLHGQRFGRRSGKILEEARHCNLKSKA